MMKIDSEEYVRNYYDEIMSTIKSIISPSKGSSAILLEIGCGYGKDTYRYATGYGKYIGIDIDQNALEVAQKENKGDNYEYLLADASKEAGLKIIPTNSIDAVVMIYVMEHIEHPEYLFREVSRVLKFNGVFCVMTPNLKSGAGILIRILPQSLKYVLKKKISKHSEEYPTYYRANTIRALDRLAGDVGLERRRYEFRSTRGYLFAYFGFFRWHLFWSKIFNWKPLRRFKTIIIVSYQKG